MKLATFLYEGQTRIGEVIDDQVYPAAAPDTMEALIAGGLSPARGGEQLPLSSVKLLPPLRPGKIIAIGRNYAEHAAELGNEVPKDPLLFAKLTSSVIAHGDTITWSPAISAQVDWEGELAVVIGKPATNVSEADALEYVFGYTCANDVSARDLQAVEQHWVRAKGLDTFCPLGPYIVTRDALPDPQKLQLRTLVNGQVMQDSSTAMMIYPVATLIAYCSRYFTLHPGDVLLTGTPAGVGKGMKPPRFLTDGDLVTVSIEGVGELTNPCKLQD